MFVTFVKPNLAAHDPAEPKQLDGVSFVLRRGRTLGILGANECGKTTLGQLLLGRLVVWIAELPARGVQGACGVLASTQRRRQRRRSVMKDENRAPAGRESHLE